MRTRKTRLAIGALVFAGFLSAGKPVANADTTIFLLIGTGFASLISAIILLRNDDGGGSGDAVPVSPA